MKAFHLTVLVIIGLVLLYREGASEFRVAGAATSVPASSARSEGSFAPSLPAGVPQKAWRVLQVVRETGEAPEGYVGGRVFQNREGRLPDDGDYREFDVDPHHGGRNAERLIVEWRTKRAWYTGDHYQTFVPLP